MSDRPDLNEFLDRSNMARKIEAIEAAVHSLKKAVCYLGFAILLMSVVFYLVTA